MGMSCPKLVLMCSGNSGFEDNFKQAVSFSEGFLEKVLGIKL
jgi:hypothetical protein